MPKVFISYRRVDSAYFIGRVYDRLEAQFGGDNIFKDVENIPPGQDYREVLGNAVVWCDVMLVVIGPTWLTAESDEGKRRLFEPNDYVRFEVETALARKDVLVIPLLVMDAEMPATESLPPSISGLVFRNALPVRGDPDFNRDMRVLIKYLQDIDNPPPDPDDDSLGYQRRAYDKSTEINETPKPPAPQPQPAVAQQTYEPPPTQPSGAEPRSAAHQMYAAQQQQAQFNPAATPFPQGVPIKAKSCGLGRLMTFTIVAIIAMCVGCLALVSVLPTSTPADDDNDARATVTPTPSESQAQTTLRTTTASVNIGGVIVSADVPGGWDWTTATDGFMYIGSSQSIVDEASGGMSANFDNMFGFTELRLSTSGTLVGISYGFDTTGTGMSGYEFAQLMATSLQSFGTTAGATQISNGRYSGGRVSFGSDGYTRYIEVYQVNFGTYVYMILLSDQARTHDSQIRTISESVQVN